jgi:hypothetical protein
MPAKKFDYTDTLTELCQAIDRHSAAIKYAADKIGFAMDNLHPEAAAEITIDPKSFEKPGKEISFDDIKTALNAYAKKEGKEKALELVNKFAGSANPKDIPEDKYSEVIQNAA